jgi:hypothetical protein
MARPRLAHLRTTMKLSLPAPTVARLDLLFEDPLTGRPKYGARSKLIDALLRRYYADLEGEVPPELPTLAELRASDDEGDLS